MRVPNLLRVFQVPICAHARVPNDFGPPTSACVSAALFSHLAQLRGKQEIRATSASLGSKNKKAFCLELTVRSAILSHVHSHVYIYACVCIVYVCHAQEHVVRSLVNGILPY